ncbi:MAG: LTA synthase family protein [Oscillospiraceae bacterium]|nr:LTA synthase family protein [Oscillospiraceae bacterium]
MKQFIVFEEVLYTAALDTRLFRYCLLWQPGLIKYVFIRLIYGFLHGIGAVTDEDYFSRRWSFLGDVKNPERRIKKFWHGPFRGRLSFRPEWARTLWLSRMPEQVLRPCAARYGAAVTANTYDFNAGRFYSFDDFDGLYREGVKVARPSELLDGLNHSVQGSVRTRHVCNGKIFPDLMSARWRSGTQIAAAFAVLVGLGVLLGVISLYFAPEAELRRQDFFAFFGYPDLIMLNILPVIVIIIFFYYLTNRVAIAFAGGCVVTLTPTFVNYYKLMFRNDPLYASDIMLLRETQEFAGTYGMGLTKAAIAAILLCVALVIMCAIFQRRQLKRGLSRAAGLVVTLCAAAGLANLYASNEVYAFTNRTNPDLQWSETAQYTTRGFVYPFLYSITDVAPPVPEGYDAEAAAKELAKYPNVDIPEEKKVNIVAVMCEAFNDFSKFGVITFPNDVYKPLHSLEEKSYYGELVTNIFAGGTVDTEWGFLTGNSEEEHGFRGNVNSYVRYLRSQGYFAEGSHPGDDWFYNRINVNEFLGFNRYYFYQNYYDRLAPNEGFASDDDFFAEITKLYEQHVTNTKVPYFSFSVTYQNHGPYNSEVKFFDKEYAARNDLTEENWTILNNYLSGIANTVQNISDTAEYFAERDEPVIFIVFGDHNPWLGNNGEVYSNLGISFSNGNDGFEAYYSVPYLIYANEAAKRILGVEYVGEGPQISPCFLMGMVFELGDMGGDNYMNAANELMRTTPVIHHAGVMMIDGKWGVYKDKEVDSFRRIQYYRRHNFTE